MTSKTGKTDRIQTQKNLIEFYLVRKLLLSDKLD